MTLVTFTRVWAFEGRRICAPEGLLHACGAIHRRWRVEVVTMAHLLLYSNGMGGLDAWGRMWLGAMDALQGWATPRVAP